MLWRQLTKGPKIHFETSRRAEIAGDYQKAHEKETAGHVNWMEFDQDRARKSGSDRNNDVKHKSFFEPQQTEKARRPIYLLAKESRNKKETLNSFEQQIQKMEGVR